MVVGKALDRAVRAVAEGDQARCRQDPRLAHASADHLARSVRASDEVLRADHQRADRAGQALGETKGGTVGRTDQRLGGGAQGHDGVEQPRSVDVQRDTARVRQTGHAGDVVSVQRSPERRRVRVLHRHQGGRRLVRIVRPERALDVRGVPGAVVTRGDRPHRGAADDGIAASLHLGQMGGCIGDDLATAGHVGHVRDEVAHGPAGHEERRLLVGQLRGTFLQLDDGRIVTEDIVSHLGRGHGPAHGRRGLCDGIGTQIDEVGHGRQHIPWFDNVGAAGGAAYPVALCYSLRSVRTRGVAA